MKGKLIFLGTGASLGVPIIGCSCKICLSQDPQNQRLRPSALVQVNEKKFLIDMGPDFRQQALRQNLMSLDGILFTHSHQDHTGGIDDIRAICHMKKEPIPILLSSESLLDIQNRFKYLFEGQKKEQFKFHVLSKGQQEIEFEGNKIGVVEYFQSGMKVNGFRFGTLAYLTDIKQFTPDIFSSLKGVEILIISALRLTMSPSHLSLDEAVDFSKQVGVKEAWITHISHELDHIRTNAYLPSFIRLAYDGLTLQFE